MSVLEFNPTSPDSPYEDDEVVQPRNMDLPLIYQLTQGQQCACPGDPYDLANHTIIGEIFDDAYDTEVLHTVSDDSWTRLQSDGQDDPVNDIFESKLNWDDLGDLESGRWYWMRIRGVDASGTNFLFTYFRYKKGLK